MHTLYLSITKTLEADAAHMRSECFPGPNESGLREDEFDEQSWHVYIRDDDDNALAAYGRLTPAQPGVFATWTMGQAQLPAGDNVCDLGRCLVSPAYRGLDLFKLICGSALGWAECRHYLYVNGTYRPDRFVGTTLAELGFVPVGPVVMAYEPNGVIVGLQPACTDLHLTNSLRDQQRSWCIRNLQENHQIDFV